MTSSAADIFVSYKAEDRRRVEPLVAALEAEGFSVWWDAHIGGGTNWREDIQDHLDAAKCVIVAWTKRSVGHDGGFVRDEASEARRRGTYLPIRLEAVEPPLGFREVQALSLHGSKGDRTDPRFRAVASFDDPSRFKPKHHFGAESMHRAWLNTEGLPEMRTQDYQKLVDKWVEARGKCRSS